MGNLLDLYQEMQSSTMEKIAEEQIIDERMEVLNKYAALADDLLAHEVNLGTFNDYGQNDVVKLAQYMIEHDINEEEKMEKVAEAYDLGVIMGQGFQAAIG